MTVLIKLLETTENLGGKKTTKEDIEHAIAVAQELDSLSLQDLIESQDADLFLMKVWYETCKSYGEAKFYEGVEAARTAIVDDHSVPPQFVP